jgi:hypothetical protein
MFLFGQAGFGRFKFGPYCPKRYLLAACVRPLADAAVLAFGCI